ncbi:43329_t:CDS:2 [Gigaspora margarita]|uniref:43329_t:CDS:1 n=1 Tax=Gigaspora margarita TaxID=4874 RepID=A0ABN7V7U9_GIGMA|nr:43329_t:CDS:2 [Gigaspora margarita]
MDVTALINQANPDKIRETSNGTTNVAVIHDYKPNTRTVKALQTYMAKKVWQFMAIVYSSNRSKKEIQNLVTTQAIQQILEQSPILGLQNKLKKHNYPSPKEKDKPNEMRLQYISKEVSDPCQEISVNNRETASNSQCTIKGSSWNTSLILSTKALKQLKCRNPFRESVEQQKTKTPYQYPRNESDLVCVHDFHAIIVISELVPIIDEYANRSTTTLANGQFHDPGLPQQAINLYCKALDPNSTNTVSSNIRAWTAWCTEHTKDPIHYPLEDIMKFLTTKANEGKSYNTIAAYRLTISEDYKYIDNLPVGQNQDIAKLMLGIFRSNPPAESSDNIYDITPSLDFIVSLGDNSQLLLITLAKKTAFLCALLSTSRPSDLARLNLTTLTNTQNGITIQCINAKEINIAIATSLHHYLDRTQNLWFTNEQKTAVFLSCIGLHRPASINSIANWLKDIIKKSAPDGKAKDI